MKFMISTGVAKIGREVNWPACARLSGLLQLNNCNIRRELGWITPFALEKGLRQSTDGGINTEGAADLFGFVVPA